MPNDPSPKTKNTLSDGPSKPRGLSSGKRSKAQMRSLTVSSERDEVSSSVADSTDSKTSLRQRMMRFLFNNVDRAVDELYYFCEDEEDAFMAQEAANVMKRCSTDFEKLISRLHDQRSFEEGKQSGVSWEVRKTSIGVRRSQVKRSYYNKRNLLIEHLL